MLPSPFLKTALHCGAIFLAALLLSQCGGSGGLGRVDYDPGYGPFDENGDYLESEADKPGRRKRPARSRTSSTAVASTESKTKSRSTKEKKMAKEKSKPVVVAALKQPSSPPASSMTTKRYKTTSSASTQPKPKSRPKTVAKAKPKPKPAVKRKPAKSAPKLLFHTVRKGDTLYNISRRYGSTVSAIQRRNGLKGTTIRIGQVLKVPK